MGNIISGLGDERLQTFQQSVAYVVQICRESDPEIAQLVTDVVESSDARATLIAHVKSQKWIPPSKPAVQEDGQAIPTSIVSKDVFQFILEFTKQDETRQRLLDKDIQVWTSDPSAFFGNPPSSPSLSTAVSVQRLVSWVTDLDNKKLLPRIRRRVGLAAITSLHSTILEKFRSQMALNQLTLNQHQKLTSVVRDVLIENIRQSGISEDVIEAARTKLSNQLRYGGRYNRFPSGMLIATGSVKSSTIERPSNEDFEAILGFCAVWCSNTTTTTTIFGSLEAMLKNHILCGFDNSRVCEIIALGERAIPQELIPQEEQGNPSLKRKADQECGKREKRRKEANDNPMSQSLNSSNKQLAFCEALPPHEAQLPPSLVTDPTNETDDVNIEELPAEVSMDERSRQDPFHIGQGGASLDSIQALMAAAQQSGDLSQPVLDQQISDMGGETPGYGNAPTDPTTCFVSNQEHRFYSNGEWGTLPAITEDQFYRNGPWGPLPAVPEPAVAGPAVAERGFYSNGPWGTLPAVVDTQFYSSGPWGALPTSTDPTFYGRGEGDDLTQLAMDQEFWANNQIPDQQRVTTDSIHS